MTGEIRPPFKFLDPYTKADRDIFFGRDREIDELYSRLLASVLPELFRNRMRVERMDRLQALEAIEGPCRELRGADRVRADREDPDPPRPSRGHRGADLAAGCGRSLSPATTCRPLSSA